MGDHDSLCIGTLAAIHSQMRARAYRQPESTGRSVSAARAHGRKTYRDQTGAPLRAVA
jgi:hypothetical protein